MRRLATPLKISATVAAMVAAAAAIAFVATTALSRADRPEAEVAPLAAPEQRSGAAVRGERPRSRARGAPRAAASRQRSAVERIEWRDSRAVGRPDAGRLVDGVELPAAGGTFFTWDPIRKRRPNRDWRRYGTDVVVRHVLRIAREFARDNPGAPRIAVGDLSRPHGGDFGPEWGSIGHASHQNGLDVDVYYPLRSGRERAPLEVSEIDMPLAQDLVDRFVAAGAEKVFVGPSTPLSGPPDIVQKLVHHDNHLHARFR